MNRFLNLIRKASSTFSRITGNKYYQSILQWVGFDVLLFDEENKVKLVEDGYAKTADVYSVVSKIARTAASITWYVEEVMPDGSIEKVFNSKLNDLLECPNRLQSWNEFMEEHLVYRLTTGDSYIYGLAPEGFPETYFTELNNLQAQNVVIVAGNEVDPIAGYRMNWDTTIKYQHNEVLHLYYPNPSARDTQAFYGLSPLKAACRVWKTSSERWEASANVLKNGGVTGILSDESERSMRPEEADKLQEQANEDYGGAGKFGRIRVSNKKLRYLQLGLNPEQLQLLEQGVISLRALCNAYHVSSALFNDPEGKKNNNQKEAEKALWQDAVIPELIKTRAGLNRWVAAGVGAFEGRNLRYNFDTSQIEVLQADQERLTNRLTKLRLAGILSGNEVREKEGFSKVEGNPEMDAYIISSNLQDIRDINQPEP